MTAPTNAYSPYRFRLSRRSSEETNAREHARLWTDIGADPRARMRCGVFAASDGAEVPYRLWPARANLASVLLLHGAFDYSAAFDEIGPRLARKGLTALAIDQRGFGATSSRASWAGEERLANDVGDAANFLHDRFGVDRPFFVLGESMGAAVAVRAAAHGIIPLLAGLVLIAPGALASRLRQKLLALTAAAARRLVGDSELVFERHSGWDLTPAAAIRLIGDPLVMRRIRPEMLCGMADLAFSAVGDAASVTKPVLTMVGARDELVRLGCVRRLFDNLAGEKSWRVIPDAPHLLLHWRRSNEIVREAVEWMTAQLPNRADAGTEEIVFTRNSRSAGAGLD
jgi:alpha-beta hydrolase superfamily lysophospholipase